jgi:hypothetical protein
LGCTKRGAKNPIKINDQNYHRGDKREGQKRPKDAQPHRNQRKKRAIPFPLSFSW